MKIGQLDLNLNVHTHSLARTAWPSISKAYLFISEEKQARNIEIWGSDGGDNKKGHCVLVRAAV
jgi:hypothetical protein